MKAILRADDLLYILLFNLNDLQVPMPHMSRWMPLSGAALVLSLVANSLSAQARGGVPPFMLPPSVDTTPRPAPDPGDVASPEAIVSALYALISGPAGERRDWNRLRSLFVPHARMMPTRGMPDSSRMVVMMSIDDYVGRIGPRLEEGGFFEREVSRKVEAFGSIMHVFSTYESRRALADAKPFARGINSIQLLRDKSRWWIVSVYWDAERPGLEIPAKYLPDGK